MTVADQENDAPASSPIDQRALDVGAAALKEQADPSPLGVPALALAAATAAGVFSADEGTAEEAVAKCLVVDGLTEKVEKAVVNENATAGAGSTVEYVDGFFDSSGTRVGTVTGTAVVLTMTPHMWQYHRGHADFTDGTFETTGIVDCTAALRGMTQVLQVVGTGGRYEGKSGYLTLAIGDPTQRPPHYSTTLVMC
jgi:Allene oxide cyclase barrel like domain